MTSFPSLPNLPVERALKDLGHNIAQARRRRQWTQRMLADHLGVSTKTVGRMEDGHAGTAVHLIARALQAFGELDALGQLLDHAHDNVGIMMMESRLPQRIRMPRLSSAPATKQGA
jgi:DNA-binding XRE family transcriptional regulator